MTQAHLGQILRLQGTQFMNDGWQLINDVNAMRTLGKILGIDLRAGYKSFKVKAKPGLANGAKPTILEVWAAWLPEPQPGDILLCVYVQIRASDGRCDDRIVTSQSHLGHRDNQTS